MEHIKHLPNGCELVVGGGFEDNESAKSTVRDIVHLSVNQEEADTCLILNACDAVTSTFNRIVVVRRDTDVLLLLLHFIGDKQEIGSLDGE